MRIPPLGAHVRRSDPLAAAAELDADCVQIFLSAPQSWKKPPERGDAQELRESDIDIYVHAPYLINVCSPRNNVRYGSRKILQQTCDAAGAIGAAAVVVHPGHAEDGIEAGIGRWPRTLEMLESEVPVLLENTAGGEHAVARRFDALATPLGGRLRLRGADPDRLLLRHLPRPRGGRGALGRRRAGAGDHRSARPAARQRLPRPPWNGRRPPHEPGHGEDGHGCPAHDDPRGSEGQGTDSGRDARSARRAAGRPRIRPRCPEGVTVLGADYGTVPATAQARAASSNEPSPTPRRRR